MSATAMTVKHIPLAEEILSGFAGAIGGDYAGYRNHVFRVINFCFAQGEFSAEQQRKIVIAGCFHDLGIWTAATFDYLPPSIALAEDYLREKELDEWRGEVVSMIAEHHKIRRAADAPSPLVEIFRKSDLADFSLGLIKSGLPRGVVKSVKKQFPNAGFHRCLARVAGGWILKHPLNPVPVLKW